MTGLFRIRVRTPDGLVLDGLIRSARIPGVDGQYGVLSRHARMVVATAPGILSVQDPSGETRQLFISDGFAQVGQDVLSIVCDAAEHAADIDVTRAMGAAARARSRLANHADPAIDVARAEAALARAISRIRLAGRLGS